MGITRRKFLKWLATLLAAWGIAPAALLKSTDKVPFDGWREVPVDLVNQKGVTLGRRVTLLNDPKAIKIYSESLAAEVAKKSYWSRKLM